MATVEVTPEALSALARLPRVIRERFGKLFGTLEGLASGERRQAAHLKPGRALSSPHG